MLRPKTTVKLDQALYERALEYSADAGYSSVDEFVQHVVERELAKSQESATREDVERKLKGLGYLE